MERVKLDNKRILFNLLPAHVAQHFLMSNPRNMVSAEAERPLWPPQGQGGTRPSEAPGPRGWQVPRASVPSPLMLGESIASAVPTRKASGLQ